MKFYVYSNNCKKTILFVSHDVEEALRLADRILILQKGQVVQFDTPLNIVTKPANAFVRNLVGADDSVRLLSLVRVTSAMARGSHPSDPGDSPTITPQDTLRQALSLLLKTGAPKLTVLDNGSAVGVLTLDHIRALTSTPDAA